MLSNIGVLSRLFQNWVAWIYVHVDFLLRKARGLFKGMSSPLASVAVINAMIFGVYGNVQRRLDDPTSLKSHALAGSVAGLVQSFICSPMELVKTRLQIQEQVCSNGVQLYK